MDYLNSYKKAPNAVLDYTFKWASYLKTGETIATATFAASPTGELTVGANGVNGTNTTCWLSGGVDGTDYEVSCTITTSQGRTDTRTILVAVERR